MSAYNAIRMILVLCSGTVIVWTYLKLVRTNHLPKVLRIAICAGLIVLAVGTLVILNVPFENKLFAFSTPEKALFYWDGSKALETLHGSQSSMVIYRTDQGKSQTIFLKTDRGFVLPNGFWPPRLRSYSIVTRKNFGSRYWEVYRVKGTEDYYIVGSAVPADTSVQLLRDSGKASGDGIVRFDGSFFFFLYVESLNEHDFFVIDGEKMQILE